MYGAIIYIKLDSLVIRLAHNDDYKLGRSCETLRADQSEVLNCIIFCIFLRLTILI